jgi:hypothetical protein
VTRISTRMPGAPNAATPMARIAEKLRVRPVDLA